MDLNEQAKRLAEYDCGAPDRDLRLIGRKVRKRLASNPAVQTIASGRAELWALPGFLDLVECGRLMVEIDNFARPSKAYAPGHDRNVRTSSSADFSPLDPFIAQIERRIDSLLGLDHASGEILEGQRYAPGQYFMPHIDWFSPGSADFPQATKRGGQRAITAMAYLNAVEEGGETDFPELDIAIAPMPGALVVWNNADADGLPNPLMAHAGNPVIRGVKYIVTKWYRCGRYR